MSDFGVGQPQQNQQQLPQQDSRFFSQQQQSSQNVQLHGVQKEQSGGQSSAGLLDMRNGQ
jgi:hypothetical protein